MAAKILNLDELQTEKTVIFGGKERRVRGMTVDEFLTSSDFDEKFRAANPREQVGLLVDQLTSYVSETTKEELGKLEIPQLSTLLNYVRGMDRVEDEKKPEGNAQAPK